LLLSPLHDFIKIYITIPVKVKVKVSCALNEDRIMKVYWGSAAAPRILELSNRWRWVASFMPRMFYRQKEPLVPTG